MKIKDYLDWKNLSVANAAGEIKISRQWLSAIVYDHAYPSRALATRIRQWSNDNISETELLIP